MAKKKTKNALDAWIDDDDAADQFLQAQGAPLRDISQNELEMLIDRAFLGGDKAAAKELKELIAKDVIHIPQGKARPVLGPAPKPKAEVVPQDLGKSGKKELTAAEKKEMEAAEKKAVEAAAARKKAEQEELNKLLAEKKAAEEAKAAAAAAEPEEPAKPKVERPAEEKAKKNAPGKETKTPTSKSVAAGIPTREVAPARDVSPRAPEKKETGVPVEKPSRQEQQAQMEVMKKRSSFNQKLAASRMANAAKANPEFAPDASNADKLKALRARWAQMSEVERRDFLQGKYGSKITENLNPSDMNRLGLKALADEEDVFIVPSEQKAAAIRNKQARTRDAEKAAKKESAAMSRERVEPKPSKKKGKKTADKGSLRPLQDIGSSTKPPLKPTSTAPAVPAPAAGKMPAERATKLRQVLAEKGLTEQRLLTAINKKAKKGKYTTIEELPEALDKRIAEWIKKAEKTSGVKNVEKTPDRKLVELNSPTPAPAPMKASPKAAAAAAAAPEAAGPMAGPWSEAAPGGRVMGPTPATGELGPTAPSSLATGKAPKVPAPVAPTTPAPAAATGKKPSASEIRDRAKKIFGNKGVGAMGGAMRFLGPLLGAFTAYQLLDMARQGTVGAADERRLQALQALGGVSGGLMSDAQQKQQLRQMQQMVDLAAIQRQQGLDQMRQQYTTDQTLNSLLAGNERALAALAMPSRPSIAEMMARY
jgi:hypothetical protein